MTQVSQATLVSPRAVVDPSVLHVQAVRILSWKSRSLRFSVVTRVLLFLLLGIIPVESVAAVLSLSILRAWFKARDKHAAVFVAWQCRCYLVWLFHLLTRLTINFSA